MCSSDDVLGWRTVENTVDSRMIDSSLIHKLIPHRKLRRRTKALNAALKTFSGSSTYSQYVKAKTSVLRNLSDDSETDDSSSFSDEDYTILYKSDVSLKQYGKHNSKNDWNVSQEDSLNRTEEDIPTMLVEEGEKTVSKKQVRKSKSKKTRAVNLGWQSVIKKNNRDSDVAPTSNTRDRSSARLSTELEENSLGTTDGKSTDTVENRVPQAPESPVSTSPGKSGMVAERGSSDSVRKKERRYSNCKQNRRDLCLEEDQLFIPDANPIDWSTPLSSRNDKHLLQKAVESVRLPSQPKDSGIDDDSQEESSEDRQIHGETSNKTTKQNAETARVCSTKSDRFGSATFEDSENVPTEEKTDALEAISPPSSQEENGKQRHKLQPKVMCTEIVSKKYKIISGEKEKQLDSTSENHEIRRNSENDGNVFEESSIDVERDEEKSKNGELQSDDDLHEKEEKEEEDDNDEEEYGVEDMSTFTKRRLQQLKRLNLTVDSDSSSADDDAALQPNDTSGVSAEIRGETDNEEEEVTKRDNEESRVSSKHALSDAEAMDESPSKKQKKKKKNGEQSRGQDCDSDFVKDDRATEEAAYARRKKETKRLDRSNSCDKSVPIAALRKRPHNLQELIEDEGMIEKAIEPSIVLKNIDFEEDDIFIFEIPETILQSELVGERITLTGKKLRIGKEKYEVFYKSVDSASCIFGTGKSRRAYRAVNVKPFATIVTGRKIQKANDTEVRSDETEDSEHTSRRKRSRKEVGEEMKNENKGRTKREEKQEELEY